MYNILYYAAQVEHWSPYECATSDDYVAAMSGRIAANICLPTVGCLGSIWPEANCTEPRPLGMGPGMHIHTPPLNAAAFLAAWFILKSTGYVEKVSWVMEMVILWIFIHWGLALMEGWNPSNTIAVQLDNYDQATWTMFTTFLTRILVVLLIAGSSEWVRRRNIRETATDSRQAAHDQ